MIFIVACICTVFIFFAYKIKRTLISPTIIICSSYLVSILFCVYYSNKRECYLTDKTMLLVLLGIIGVFSGEMFSLIFFSKKKINCSSENKLRSFFVPRYMFLLFFVFQLITVFLFYKEVSSLAGNYANFTEMLSNYMSVSYFSGSVEDNINMVVTQLGKISFIGTILSVMVVINNSFIKAKKKQYFLLLSLIPLSFQTLLISSRFALIQIAIASVCFLYLLFKEKHMYKKRVATKTLAKISIYCILFLVFFWSLRNLIGHSADFTNNFVEYIAYYFSGGLAFLNKSVSYNLINSNELFGAYTFTGFYSFLTKFDSTINVVSNYEFMYSGSIHGNTYTALCAYYRDFGYFGVFFMEFLASFIYAFCLNYLRYNKMNSNSFYAKTIFLCIFIFPLFYDTIAAQFYRHVFSFSFFMYAIIYCLFIALYNHLMSYKKTKLIQRNNCVKGNLNNER